MYGRLQAGGYPMSQFSVDGYAVQHPGVPGPQAAQSVCGHLMNLCRVLERGGNAGASPAFLRSVTHRPYPWLTPPEAGYPLTVADLVAVSEHHRFKDVEREYAEGVWSAWAKHHETIRHWVDDPGSMPRKA